MFAQLIAIDFSKGKRQVDFERLAGHPRNIISYCAERSFEDYNVHLFNYERLDNRALCELAFLFEKPVNTRQEEPLTPELAVAVKRIDCLYRQIAKVELVVVSHHPRTTICGYVPTDGLAEIGERLDWLIPIKDQENTDEQSVGGEDTEGTP